MLSVGKGNAFWWNTQIYGALFARKKKGGGEMELGRTAGNRWMSGEKLAGERKDGVGMNDGGKRRERKGVGGRVARSWWMNGRKLTGERKETGGAGVR